MSSCKAVFGSVYFGLKFCLCMSVCVYVCVCVLGGGGGKVLSGD